ncbi:MAG: glutamate-5-semialdehyde dehydrogenase [Planctomycetia bacterium]|nr:glutamate-5-semialdehyde dehydrogenase [Planctomycetia bacterium]
MHSTETNLDFALYATEVAMAAQVASRVLATAGGEIKNRWLCRTAELIRERAPEILAANQVDLEAAPGFGLKAAAIDRLKLDDKRLNSAAEALERIALMTDPVGEILDGSVRPNGLEVSRVRVPLGVVFFIYESRPNVTVDAAGVCIKSGNAVILRGGKEAFQSNQALHKVLHDALEEVGLPTACVQLVATTDRVAVGHFLQMSDQINVTIPRGGKSLIERVMADAKMPVIKHYDGICHVYVDRGADFAMAREIVVNAKCQRPGVCNAAECLLVHAEIADQFLPQVARDLSSRGVELRCCERSRRFVSGCRPATPRDFETEFLDLIMAIRIVDDLEQAIEHIETHSSHHTDAIVTNDLAAASRFTAAVDSSAVMVNASTRFNDGGEFGLGAEIGISTDKFHARGPCGLRELTSYKYVVRGAGHVRT